MVIQEQEYSLLSNSNNLPRWLDKKSLSLHAQHALDELLGQNFKDYMIVPVPRPNNQQLFLVAVLTGKQEGLAFDSQDLQSVQQCFKYAI